MAFHIAISPRALSDIEAAYRYYVEINPGFAVSWFNGLENTIESLADFPKRCSLAFESDFFDFELRQQLYGTGSQCYRILFSIDGDEVRVHHVRHHRQAPITEIEFPRPL